VRTRARLQAAAALVLAATACGGSADGGTSSGPDVSALVQVVAVRSEPLTELLVAYGAVVPAPGSVRAFTAPFEAIVTRVHVSRGQRVASGQRLVDLAPSPEATLLLEAARSAVRAARGRMADVRDRLQLGLTTRDELLLQEQALTDAEARWDTYSQWVDGLGLDAMGAGVVDRLAISEGQRVPAGDLLVSIVSRGRFEVEVGIEPEDAGLVATGRRVSIERLAGEPPDSRIAGTVRSVSLAVDSATRLTPALVVPDAGASRLLLGEFVRVGIPVRSGVGPVVPRSAVLAQMGGHVVFVVRAGRAYRRRVTVGVETDSLVQLAAGALQAGDTVVVLGNYALSDSMAVRLPQAPSAAGARPSPTPDPQ